MVFEWGRMERGTPEVNLGKRQDRERAKASFDTIVHEYGAGAGAILSGAQQVAAKEEVTRFAKQIGSAREGVELDELTERLFRALREGKIQVPDVGDSKREQQAFAVVLS